MYTNNRSTTSFHVIVQLLSCVFTFVFCKLRFSNQQLKKNMMNTFVESKKKKKSNNLNIVKRKEKKRNESTIPLLNEFMLQNVTSHLW